MATDAPTEPPKRRPWLHQLPKLDARLRAAKLGHSPDRWLNAHDLLLRLAEEERLPDSGPELSRYLAPLFCRNPEEQARFDQEFEGWWQEIGGEPAPEPKKEPDGETKIVRLPRVPLWPFLAVPLALLAGMVIRLYFNAIQFHLDLSSSVVTKPPSVESIPPPSKDQLLPLQPIPPRADPEPPYLTPAYRQLLVVAGQLLPWLPPLGALAWLAWRLTRRRVALSHRQDLAEDPMQVLRLKNELDDLFDGPEVRAALRRLHRHRWDPTRRLHEARTLDRTLRQAGLLMPVYRERARIPEVVVWADLRHAQDPVAGLAATLVQRLRQSGLICHPFRSYGEAERLYDLDRARWTSLTELAAIHAGGRLLVVGESELFLDVWSGQALPWVEVLQSWPDRWLLSPAPEPQRRLQPLGEAGLLLAPLTSEGLHRLGGAVSGNPGREWPLPPMLEGFDRWRSLVPPETGTLLELLRVLRGYLGADGLDLLAAVATYPQIHWGLMRRLDLGLFPPAPGDQPGSPGARERRLLRLSRLPWTRTGWLPDWLRLELIRAPSRDRQRLISDLHAQLFAQVDAVDPDAIELPVHLTRRRRWDLRRWFRDRQAEGVAEDRIYAAVVGGGLRNRLLFLLPRKAARFLLRSGLLEGVPGLVLPLLLAGALGLGLFYTWEPQWRTAVERLLRQGQQLEFQGQPVSLSADTDTAPLAQGLAEVLVAYGFVVQTPVIAAAKEGPPTIPAARTPRARIRCAPGQVALAQFAAERLAWLGYGLPVEVSCTTPEQSGLGIELSTVNTAGPAGGLRDTLTQPFDRARWKAELAALEPTPAATPPPPIPVTPIEPEMLQIRAGSFLMGCGPKETGCANDEKPAHRVTLQAFSLGKYEVSFEEYDRFAEATGRERPDDQGWGRGRRPVINVSWEDATAYAAWLADQTKKPYRLPTEAEWEYAARAGTQTAFSFGDCIHTDQANYNGDYDFNNCGAKTGVYRRQTVPVDQLKPNPWGLYHIHGNVWEWTLDCWHDTYAKAPADGAAWKTKDKGDCARRVVRGGGWDFKPVGLRSAFRDWFSTAVAIYFLGFRLARTP